jgi:UDP-N-acetylglucosamine 2-epimerase (non-hydrolysing)
MAQRSRSVKRRVAVIFGTRPEAIKLAPVILALRQAADIECRVCVTGQHREMLDQVLEVFGIQPDADLRLMKPNQSLAELTSRALVAIDEYLAADAPDLVLTQGDTTTVFCATLASFYRRVPVGHVEAGLRTWDLSAPWPEEANRVLTSRLAAIHFAPTKWSRDNLRREGIPAKAIRVTGNPVIDALFLALKRIREAPPEIPGLPSGLLEDPGSRIVLITGHRRESFGEGFENICRAIADLAKAHPGTRFVYPVHLNPNVRGPVGRILGNKAGKGRRSNIHLLEPLPYLSFVALLSRAELALTDSGGIQEEAPGLGVPVLVMRETTERPEGVRAGTVKLVGASRETIVREASRLLDNPGARARMARRRNPYGDGRAAGRIVKACRAFLFGGK